MTILIPALERDGGYRDLQVLLASLAAYAPGVPVIVAYKGRQEPQGGIRAIPQPPDARHYGDACRALLGALRPTDDLLLFCNDDTVWTPDTLRLLRFDLQIIEQTGAKRGLVGLRTNICPFAAQNIRWTPAHDQERSAYTYTFEHKIAKVKSIFGIAFAVRQAVIREAPDDWMQLHWYSDNLLAYDLGQRGYAHYVSRAYVHHHGSKSGGNPLVWEREAHDWLNAHRPDYMAHLKTVGGGWAGDT